MGYGSIESIMSKDVLCASPEDTLADLLSMLHENRIGCVPVCEDDVPVGMVTERDAVEIAARALAGEEDRRVAADVMSSPVMSIRARDSLEESTARVQSVHIRYFPVVGDDGRIQGVVTQSELLSRRLTQELVEEQTVHLAEANKRLDKLARLDGMLGIGNRRWMEERLVSTHAQLQREGKAYSLALCDVDHFKLYNDHYGHLAGDRVLKCVANRLVEVLRGADQVFRFGGEELLVVLPETVVDEAMRAGERICEGIRALAIPHAESDPGIVTVSCGVAGASPAEPQWRWQGEVQLADVALYSAKSKGRNCVVSASDVDDDEEKA